jgi:hypothetical protein
MLEDAASTLEFGLGAGTAEPGWLVARFSCCSRCLMRVFKDSASEAGVVEAGLPLDAPSWTTPLTC